MTKQDKINYIYEKVGGRVVESPITDKIMCDRCGHCVPVTPPISLARTKTRAYTPILVGDVIEWYRVSYNMIEEINIDGYNEMLNDIISPNGYRKEIRKPIEEQSEECIDYIYNLVK